MKHSLAVVVLVLAPVLAHADHTAAEKNEIKKLHIGMLALDTAGDRLGQLIEQTAAAEAATAGTRTTLSGAWARWWQTYDKMHGALFWLLGLKPQGSCTGVPGCVSYTTTGEAEALDDMDDAVCGACIADVLKTNFDTLANDTNQSAGFRAIAQQGEDAMATFLAAVNAFDPEAGTWANAMPEAQSSYSPRDFGALSLTDPSAQMAPHTRGTTTAIVGPHGSYMLILGNLQFGLFRTTLGLDQTRSAWNWVANSETIYSAEEFEAFGRIISLQAQVLQNVRTWLMAAADIAVTDTDCGKSTFRYQADTISKMISPEEGINLLYKEMADEHFATITNAVASRPVARGHWTGTSPATPAAWVNMTMTPWRYYDGSVWDALEFPITKVFTLRHLREQFAHSNNTHVPPMCPDSTDPVVTSIVSPAASATISGIVTLQANVSDNIAVNNVKFFIGAQQLGRASTVAPWAVRWDSSEIANGARTITAIAYDAAGNESDPVTVNVTVAN